LFNALAFTVIFIVGYFGLTNLSLHPGYQTFKKVENYDGDQCKMKTNQHEESLMTLKDLLMYNDYTMIVLSYGILNYTSVTIELNAMTISLYNYHWTTGKLSLVVIVSIFVYLVILTLAGRNIFNSIPTVYLFYVLCFITYWILLLVLLLPALFPELFKTKTPQYILIGATLFLKIGIGYSMSTTGRCLIFYLVPDHSASFASGLHIVDSLRYF